MVSVTDSEAKVREAAELIESMMTDGLIVFSDVDVIRLVRAPAVDEQESSDVGR
jgi:hypothetical protein